MDYKKDIYNLWVQYTTKNEEYFFREFVKRFVSIWKSQLKLNFDGIECPFWHEVQPDSGPHLGRLPDELLPAIGKFIIVALDASQNDLLCDDDIEQIAILIDCLIIVCRHFDNILTIIKYDYKSNLIAILAKALSQKKAETIASSAVAHLFRSFSNFLEVVYDPFLTWRSFLRGNYANYNQLSYQPHTIHVEILPFIYDCFQNSEILKYPEIGENLLHALASIISGSQHNGMRAISPATVSIIMNIISQWESDSSLRFVALKCSVLMATVLQKSSPEERQIDVMTLIQLYCNAIEKLISAYNFSSDIVLFQIDSDESIIDVYGLSSTIDNISLFLSDSTISSALCEVINATNLIDILFAIPKNIKLWNVHFNTLLCSTLNAISVLKNTSVKILDQIRNSNNIETFFNNLKTLGPPAKSLLNACFALSYNNNDSLLVLPVVIVQLIEWIPALQDQDYISGLILKSCTANNASKSVACESRIINITCICLKNYPQLSELCMQNFIKLIEELSKMSIDPIELKGIFTLLRQESQFPQSKQLLQMLVTVSLQNLTDGNLCPQFFTINNEADGIVVPDIKNWVMSGSYGFIFHILVRLNRNKWKKDESNCRRMLLNLRTSGGSGFEVFIQNNGNIVVAALTKREYLTSSVTTNTLLDRKWHYVTVAMTPPKRPFSYCQINVYIDFLQKMSATLKVQGINEPFVHCSIGSAIVPNSKVIESSTSMNILPRSLSQETTQSSYKGMLPSLLERTLSTNVSNYFTMPLRSQTSFDPNVKNFPIGMQANIFGDQECLHGHIGAVLLAEPTTNLKTIFDAGINFSSIFSQDNDLLELTSRFVFSYSPNAYWKDICQDLIPPGRFPGQFRGKHCRTTKIQDAINSIGGVKTIFPILFKLIEEHNELLFADDIAYEKVLTSEPIKPPLAMEFSEWKELSSNLYTEWKMIQSSVARFLCFLRYLTHEHDNNQETLLSSEGVSTISLMLQKCPASLFDVNALMAIHLLLEALLSHKSNCSRSNNALLEALYAHIFFNFAIWSRLHFQISLGHIQYLNAMIKNNRKYFRKSYGILFFLDVVRQYYCNPNYMTTADVKTLRTNLFGIVRFYLQKDVNIQEIGAITSFLASVQQEHLVIELLEMMTSHIGTKNCKDQTILLLHEPQTANLLYNYFVDKSYGTELQDAAIRFISSLVSTSKVEQKYKQVLRLYDQSRDLSMLPGFFSYTIPMTLTSTVLFHLIDEVLIEKIDYAGLIFLIYSVSECDLQIKLEIAKRLLQTTFINPNSTVLIAKQLAWQESIARLLIRKRIVYHNPEILKRKNFDIDLDILLHDNSDLLAQDDLINFCDQDSNIEQEQLRQQQQLNESGLILNEIQASVSEVANVLESEIKELAESVSDAVVENVSSVFAVIRQRTHNIQDTFESLSLGASIDLDMNVSKQRKESISSDSSTKSQNTTVKNIESDAFFELTRNEDVDSEEQLEYLVSNILFNVFWRGISNDNTECWKERGKVLGCINLLALNNELITSHLSLRLRILEMAVQASLFDLSEHGNQTLINQENASNILRMVYDLVVLGSNEDESKKCSVKLLDGVLALLDVLMIFQTSSSDDWSDMIRLCLGLLLKCSLHPNPGIVAMATAKLHAILQSRSTDNPSELAYLLYSINKALDNAIEVGNPEEYSFLIPVMKALLEKCRYVFNLDSNLPDIPSTSSGPIFFNDFQMYSTSRKWRNFIEKIVKPLFDSYQNEIELNLWEPINRFWAECYEACKSASKKRASFQAENRRLFQEKIIMPWKVRQMEEASRLSTIALQLRTKNEYYENKWKTEKRFLYGPRGPWFTGNLSDEFWMLSNHENIARMRFKLEPLLYPKNHEIAANLRDNATNSESLKKISEFDTTIKSAVIHDFLLDDSWLQLEEELRQSIEVQSQHDVTLEKSLISQDCELITLMTKVKGRIEVNQSVFTFVSLRSLTDQCNKQDFRFSISKIREVHLRKYNLRRSALEIFLTDQTSYFLNFSTTTRNKVFTKILSLQPPNILYGSGRSPAELFRTSGLSQKWMNREVTNFEYLMYLNTIAGRSYNDLSQYPVFPWILADYTSDILDLTDPKSFRDLSKPIGVVSHKNEMEVRTKYESFEDLSGAIPKFHYGSHYSNSAGVLHYLLRVEPFTSLHIELQSGRFDVADRQFHSIAQTWKLLMDNPNDVKELIPEFFYFPEFLKNINRLDLGYLQASKEKVDNVILPPWATTPEEFIAIHRRALESEYVSQNIHHWIDLIFGYKQKGSKAVEALNVFYYCSYEGAVDLDKISNPNEREAIEGMINNFGQVPSQLMREPHPRRLTQDEVVLKLLRAEIKRPDLTQFLDKVVVHYCDLSTPRDPVIFLSSPRSPPRSFLQMSPDVLVSISKSCILGCNSWISHDKERGFLLETDATTSNLKNRKRIFGPLHSSQLPDSKIFAVSIDGKYLYVGGIWDNSLRVFSISKGKMVASVQRHFDIITCIALDYCGAYLVTGSRDCTCIIWSILTQAHCGSQSSNIHLHTLTGQVQVVPQLNTQSSISPIPLTVLYGHDAAITCVAIYTELNMVVSGSLDGTVNVYTIHEGQFVRTLKPIGCTEFCAQISYLTVSYHGHIAFSAFDDVSHSVHVYSANGSSLGWKYVSGRVTGLTTASDYLIVADDAGDITISRMNGLKPVFDIPLHVPIQTVVVAPGNTHIHAPLRDGRIAVITVQMPVGNNKKHSVLNV